MDQDKSIYSFKPHIRYNKNFVYKSKKYPIDFSLIKKNSNYFYERRDQYKNDNDIQLSEELIDISEESIPIFISSCHNESFEISNTNVFSLYQLSVKYEVPSLLSLTDDYIKKHDKALIFQSIQYKLQYQHQNPSETENLTNLKKDEEYIASIFFDYINDEQLLNLPIPVLYGIINNTKLDINQLNETNKNQFIDFLFKCLDKYGKKASVLFLNLNLENQRIEIFSKLINEYSEKFDFNMINSKFLMQTTTDLLSELSQLKLDYSNSIKQINQVLKQIEDEKQKQQDLTESFKKFAQEQLNEQSKKLNESFKDMKNQIETEKQKQQDLTESFKKFAQEQLNEQSQKLNESFKDMKNQIETEKQKLQEFKNSIKQSTQAQLNEESEKLNRSLQNLKNNLENEIRNSKDYAERNINEIRSLVRNNSSKMDSFVTKSVLNIFIF